MTFEENEQIKALKRISDSYIRFITEFRESAAFLKTGLPALDRVALEHGVSDKLLETFLYETFKCGVDCVIDTEIVLNQEWFYLYGTKLYNELFKYHQDFIENMMDSAYDDEIKKISSLESLYKYISENKFPSQLAVEAIEKMEELIRSFFCPWEDMSEKI